MTISDLLLYRVNIDRVALRAMLDAPADDPADRRSARNDAALLAELVQAGRADPAATNRATLAR